MNEQKDYSRYTANFDKALHEKLSSDVRAEMARNKIFIRHIAADLNKSNKTINLWLLKNVTQARYDILMASIKRIVAARNEE